MDIRYVTLDELLQLEQHGAEFTFVTPTRNDRRYPIVITKTVENKRDNREPPKQETASIPSYQPPSNTVKCGNCGKQVKRAEAVYATPKRGPQKLNNYCAPCWKSLNN